MNVTVNRKILMSWIVIFCMIVPMLIPVFAYAQTNDGVISVDGQDYAMSVLPESGEIGIMVSAKDIADAFSLEYTFDSENKAFEIYDDKHGKIVLMHNATTFYSGENVYDCNPYFYVRNGEPLVEIGFFCNMFASSYTYVESENKIVVDKNKISDDVAKVSYKGKVTPLYIEPIAVEYGLITRVADLASCFNLTYKYDETSKMVVLTNDNGESVELIDGANSFKSSYGEFECGTFFNVINDIPMIEVGFFCDLYGASYEYDEENKTLNISDDITMTEKLADESIELLSSDAILSGSVNYPVGAPEGGLNVKLILQQTGSRYQMYQGYTYYTGNNYVLGTVKFDEGETSQSYEYDVSGFRTSTYTTYALYYEESDIEEYGYCNSYGTTSSLSYSPLYSSTYNYSAKQFSYSWSPTVNFVIGKNYISGEMNLADNQVAPSGGIDVDLILQTRTKTYTNIYGSGSFYNVGSNNNIGTVTIPNGVNSVNYKFDISDCFTDANTYCYYSLYYSAEDNDCVVPYGYYNTYGTVTRVNKVPTSGSCYYTTAKVFDFMSCEDVDFTLPIQDNYVPDMETVKTPTSNVESGYVANGAYISLSTLTSDADIYYTTDGSIPTTSSNKYTGSIVIEKDTVIKAFAVKSGMSDSNVATYTYVVNNNDFIKFVVGDANAIIDGEIVKLDVAPVVIDESVYVPIRVIGESMGATVEWNSTLQQVIIVNDGKSLTLTVGDGDCWIIDGRTLVNANTVFEELLGDDYVIECTPISVTVNEKEVGEPSIKVVSAKSAPGKTVDVVVEIKNNPGIAVIGFDVEYDSAAMTLVEVNAGEIFSSSDITPGDISKNPYTVSGFNGEGNKTNDGKLVTLSFEVNDTCAEGTYAIKILNSEAYNIDELTVEFVVENGNITIKNIEPGDANGDGIINRMDLLRVAKYFAGWETDMDDYAADVTGDGKVNRMDLLRLAKYFAGWEVQLGQ